MEKLQIRFNYEGIEIIGLIDNVVDNEEELRKFQKTCKRAIVDLSNKEIERALEKGELQNQKNSNTTVEEIQTQQPVYSNNLATAKQKEYLTKLGIEFDVNITKEEASAAIEKYYNRKK